MELAQVKCIKSLANRVGSKLNESLVKEIRALYQTGDYTKTAIARQYGVIIQVMSAIIARKSWKHVE